MDLRSLLDRYVHAVDGRDWDGFATIFHDDIVCDMQGVGLPLTTTLDELRSCFSSIQHPVAHHAINPLVEVTGPDEVRMTSKWLVVLPDRSCLSGTYTDDVVRAETGWRIRHRVIRATQERSHRPVPGYDAAPR